MTSVFDDIFIPNTLAEEAKALLQKWFPVYLTGLEDRLGLRAGTFDVPNNYTERNSFTSLPGEELPKCVVLVPGIVGTPQKSGNRTYRATWRLGVGVAVSRRTEEEAKFHAEIYGACVRAMFVDHPGVNGVASNLVWVDESYDVLPIASDIQQFRSASIWFAVDIDNVVSKTQGPPEPGTTVVTHTADKVVIELDRA